MLMEHQFDQDRLIEEAWITNAGFTTLKDLGADYPTALRVASNDELVSNAYASSLVRSERMAEMVALVLQQPELNAIELRVRV